MNIDAEEASRLELSLDLVEKLLDEPELKGYKGIGYVVQAYSKRCPFVLDYLIHLAREKQGYLMIRLVKGAYWDSEIKWAQTDGLEGFPLYTRKNHTDISYIACAKKLLAAQDVISSVRKTLIAKYAPTPLSVRMPHYWLTWCAAYWKMALTLLSYTNWWMKTFRLNA